MKICGHPFSEAFVSAVQLQPYGKPCRTSSGWSKTLLPALRPQEVTYADLWRTDVFSEQQRGAGDAASFCVNLVGGEGLAFARLEFLDRRSAESAMTLLQDLHAAERALLHGLDGSPLTWAEREAAIRQVEERAARWAPLDRPVPCTLDHADPTRSPIRAADQVVVQQERVDARTLFWTMYERQPDGTSQALIDVVDFDDAQFLDAAREQLKQVDVFATMLSNGLASGIEREDLFTYTESDFVPNRWPSMENTKPRTWFQELAQRGLDFDPAAEDLHALLCDQHDDTGQPRFGRRAATDLARAVERFCGEGRYSAEDLRDAAAHTMPAAQAALSQGAKP